MWEVSWYGYSEVNGPHCNLFQGNDEKSRLGAKLPGIFGGTPFNLRKTRLFDIKRALQKGHVCSFAEKGKAPDL